VRAYGSLIKTTGVRDKPNLARKHAVRGLLSMVLKVKTPAKDSAGGGLRKRDDSYAGKKLLEIDFSGERRLDESGRSIFRRK